MPSTTKRRTSGRKAKASGRKASGGRRSSSSGRRRSSSTGRRCKNGTRRGKPGAKCLRHPRKHPLKKQTKRKSSTGGRKTSGNRRRSSSSTGKKKRGDCRKYGRSKRTGKCRKGPVTRGKDRAEYLPTEGLPASWTADMFEAKEDGWGSFSGKYARRAVCKYGRRKTATGAWGGCRTEAEAKKAREAYLKRTGQEPRWFQGQCENPPPCLATQVPYKLATGEVCCRNKTNQAESYKAYLEGMKAVAEKKTEADTSSGKTPEQIKAEAAARGGAATV